MNMILTINNGGLVSGETMRNVLEVFPGLESSFTQRKQYDEFYFTGADVKITLEDIQKLNDLYFSIFISGEDLMIEE